MFQQVVLNTLALFLTLPSTPAVKTFVVDFTGSQSGPGSVSKLIIINVSRLTLWKCIEMVDWTTTLTLPYSKSFGDRVYSYHAPGLWKALPASQ